MAGKKPHIPFDDLEKKGSIHIEGRTKSQIVQAFSQYLAKGRYSLRKEGNGYRLFLLNKGE